MALCRPRPPSPQRATLAAPFAIAEGLAGLCGPQRGAAVVAAPLRWRYIGRGGHAGAECARRRSRRAAAFRSIGCAWPLQGPDLQDTAVFRRFRNACLQEISRFSKAASDNDANPRPSATNTSAQSLQDLESSVAAARARRCRSRLTCDARARDPREMGSPADVAARGLGPRVCTRNLPRYPAAHSVLRRKTARVLGPLGARRPRFPSCARWSAGFRRPGCSAMRMVRAAAAAAPRPAASASCALAVRVPWSPSPEAQLYMRLRPTQLGCSRSSARIAGRVLLRSVMRKGGTRTAPQGGIRPKFVVTAQTGSRWTWSALRDRPSLTEPHQHV